MIRKSVEKLLKTTVKHQAALHRLMSACFCFNSPCPGIAESHRGPSCRQVQTFMTFKSVFLPFYPNYEKLNSTLNALHSWTQPRDGCSNTALALVINRTECKLTLVLPKMATTWRCWSRGCLPKTAISEQRTETCRDSSNSRQFKEDMQRQ